MIEFNLLVFIGCLDYAYLSTFICLIYNIYTVFKLVVITL